MTDAFLATVPVTTSRTSTITRLSGLPKVEDAGKESSERGIAAIRDVLITSENPTVVVTHGGLMTLILKHFDSKYGLDEWKTLTAPDVF